MEIWFWSLITFIVTSYYL
uniref:Uncharacterized protein n=1 Tax=Rhizophora mucronata TaxID=61149 RepID=A0A2P2QF23_RHIMU